MFGIHTNYTHNQCPPRGRILSGSAQTKLSKIYPLIQYSLVGTMGGLAVTNTLNKIVEMPAAVGDISLNTISVIVGGILGVIATKIFHLQ